MVEVTTAGACLNESPYFFQQIQAVDGNELQPGYGFIRSSQATQAYGREPERRVMIFRPQILLGFDIGKAYLVVEVRPLKHLRTNILTKINRSSNHILGGWIWVWFADFPKVPKNDK